MIFNEIFKYKTKKIKFNQVISLRSEIDSQNSNIDIGIYRQKKKKSKLGYYYCDS